MNIKHPPYGDLVIGLLENAIDSLVHSIEHYQAFSADGEVRNLKYTVLHSFQAIELSLKARLAKEHPLLIYERPEVTAEGRKVKSRTFCKCPPRLVVAPQSATECEAAAGTIKEPAG